MLRSTCTLTPRFSRLITCDHKSRHHHTRRVNHETWTRDHRILTTYGRSFQTCEYDKSHAKTQNRRLIDEISKSWDYCITVVSTYAKLPISNMYTSWLAMAQLKGSLAGMAACALKPCIKVCCRCTHAIRGAAIIGICMSLWSCKLTNYMYNLRKLKHSYISWYICVCTRVCTCSCVYLYMYIRVFVCVCACTCILCFCMCVCVHECYWICVSVYVQRKWSMLLSIIACACA